ncbi:hypothetical protein R1sor_019783 [Riccia sorocarpa]|uniref:Leucine-rich repeat-containing N-terminal plant-type domain-containing protein n=1 Tax=Riccia sorocarpa TaxID=122646 RepID=A0ABD3IEK8_9MARC
MRGFRRLLPVLVVVQLLVDFTPFMLKVSANNEGDALIALKRQLNDPNGFLNSWDDDLIDPCTWSHITCNADDKVIRIDLAHMGLSGSLVPELGELSSLQYLELFGNYISGSVPPELGRLRDLASLGLNRNALSGNIPAALGTLMNLKFLRLDHNDFTGEIPTELTLIPALLLVELSYNNLAGIAPKFASNVVTRYEGNPDLIH